MRREEEEIMKKIKEKKMRERYEGGEKKGLREEREKNIHKKRKER